MSLHCLSFQVFRTSRSSLARATFFPLLAAVAACGWNAAGSTGCRPAAPPFPLPDELRESSGVASSRTQAGVLWTHNDGRDSLIYGLDTGGKLVARLPIQGARIRDLEDIATGECPEGSCIYLADTGDNQEVRSRLQLLRGREPGALDAAEALEVQRFPFSLPDGPRDIEALFVLPGEEVFFVSKGRSDPATVYRYPPPLRPDQEVILEEVQALSEGSLPILSQITGADASPDGTLVAIRSYEALSFFRVEGGHLVPMEGGRVALGTLQEPQGEGVGFGPGGRIFLTTEGGFFGGVAALRELDCPNVMGG